nr:hypothetical protein [Burkholderia glumae]
MAARSSVGTSSDELSRVFELASNIEWQAAISWLTDASAAYCSGFSHYRVRRAIVEKAFGVKWDLTTIAEECNAHRNTVSKQNAAVRKWLDGDRKTGEAGVSQVAWAFVERRFVDLGLLAADAAA